MVHLMFSGFYRESAENQRTEFIIQLVSTFVRSGNKSRARLRARTSNSLSFSHTYTHSELSALSHKTSFSAKMQPRIYFWSHHLFEPGLHKRMDNPVLYRKNKTGIFYSFQFILITTFPFLCPRSTYLCASAI
jgi:hypothetical protein